MSSVLDKVRKFKATRPQQGANRHMRGIFHSWKDGDNFVRLAGEFAEVRTHFIAPAPKRSERGICGMVAFQGDEKLPQVINCPDWDIAKEEVKRVKTCPVCKLRTIALAVLHENPTDEEKAFFEGLLPTLAVRRNVKWNMIDRDDPYVLVVENGQEQKVLGFKIATIGMEAYNDIEGIFEQCGSDITDPTAGIDIKVVRGFNGTRTTYTAQACVEGLSLKVTPFTEEEAALVLHDLKTVCGKQVDVQKVVDAMHEDLRQMLEVNVDETVVEAAVEPVAEEAVEEAAPVQPPAPARPATKAATAPVTRAATAPATKAPAQAAKPAATAPVTRPAPVAAKPAAPARPAAPAARQAAVKPAVPSRPAAPAPRPVTRPAPRPAAETAAIDEAVEEAGGDGLLGESESGKV
jgi:hypothetical protein